MHPEKKLHGEVTDRTSDTMETRFNNTTNFPVGRESYHAQQRTNTNIQDTTQALCSFSLCGRSLIEKIQIYKFIHTAKLPNTSGVCVCEIPDKDGGNFVVMVMLAGCLSNTTRKSYPTVYLCITKMSLW